MGDLRPPRPPALARRDRQRRFHQPADACCLRPEHREERHLRGDARTARRFAERQAERRAGIRRQADRGGARGEAVSSHSVVPAFAGTTNDSGTPCPTKRKRPWGAGVFGCQLGGLGVLLSTWRLWGAGKEPREFLKSFC